MDFISYTLSKGIAASVASGVSNVRSEDSRLVFTLNDGKEVSINFKPPEDGISITDIRIESEGEIDYLICELSNGSTINAGNFNYPQPREYQFAAYEDIDELFGEV